METQKIIIENLKCGGCANTIKKSVGQISGVNNLFVNIDKSEVSFDGNSETRKIVAEKLTQIGYPEVGTLTGISSGIANAKSYISCAIGKISD